jgi:hypothetical protein
MVVLKETLMVIPMDSHLGFRWEKPMVIRRH